MSYLNEFDNHRFNNFSKPMETYSYYNWRNRRNIFNLSGLQKKYLVTNCDSYMSQKRLKELLRLSNGLIKVGTVKTCQEFLEYVNRTKRCRYKLTHLDNTPREIIGIKRLKQREYNYKREQRRKLQRNTDKIFLRKPNAILDRYRQIVREELLNTCNIKSPAHGRITIVNGEYKYTVSSTNLGKYSSRCTFNKIEHNISISLPFSKFRQVPNFLKRHNVIAAKLRRQLADSICIYDAVWLKRGRGFECEIINIRLLTRGNEVYHCAESDTLEQSLRKFFRKLNNETIRDVLPLNINVSEAKKLLQMIEQGEVTTFDSLKIRRTDSIRAGNCIPGTREFVDVHGLNGQREMPLREFCNQRCLDNRYYAEKLNTIAYAIKRSFSEGKITTIDIRELLSA